MEKSLKELGELAREHNDFKSALAYFNEALVESLKDKNIAEAINILGQHLLVYDRYYRETQIESFTELMLMDAQAGLRLAEKFKITGQPLALMHIRTAEYYFEHKDFSKAEELYQKAFDELSADRNASNEEKSEYLGHLAEAVIHKGDVSRAKQMFEQAHQLLNNHSEKLRDFHKLIILSGLLMRESNGLHANNQTENAINLARRIEPLVNDLKDKYQMGARYQEFLELKETLSI